MAPSPVPCSRNHGPLSTTSADRCRVDEGFRLFRVIQNATEKDHADKHLKAMAFELLLQRCLHHHSQFLAFELKTEDRGKS